MAIKSRIVAIAMGLLLAVTAARANDILAITETGENFNDLIATFNGVPLGVNLTGAADNWTIELPSGFEFLGEFDGLTIVLVEPENPLLANSIFISLPFLMTWRSELTGVAGGTSTSFTLPGAGTGPSGLLFDLVVADSPARAVPDSGTSALLLGTAFGGLALLRRFTSR